MSFDGDGVAGVTGYGTGWFEHGGLACGGLMDEDGEDPCTCRRRLTCRLRRFFMLSGVEG